jgi:RimJ/RimL family protein N-acetyltransferase/uncharacterized protein YndB with AHSA1/START domain
MTEQLHWSPVPRPGRGPIEGRSVRLEPVDRASHGPALFAAGTDPRIWDYLGVGPFADEASMRAWLDAGAPSEDPLFFTILVDGRPEGMCSYLRIDPGNGAIEIGWIWFSPALQRTRAATEAIYLLARTAFDLGYRRLEWKCDARNQPSRRAAERFGFTFEGVFRQHMVIKDRNRDTAWYAIVDQEWPSVRSVFEAWLADANFDEDGHQRERLDDVRARLGDHRQPVRWRLHLAAPPEAVRELLATDEGRARFWAESTLATGRIEFRFPGGQTWSGRVVEDAPTRFSVEYCGGSVATFELAPDGSGGTDLTLTDRGVPGADRSEVTAGWVSVLLALKAAADFEVDLRNHDPARTWDQGFADN